MRRPLLGEPVYCPACQQHGIADELIAEKRGALVIVSHAGRMHVDPRSTTCKRGHCTSFGAEGEAITPAALLGVIA